MILAATAPIRLDPAPLFSAGAVLQRERPITVFGTGTVGASVKVRLAGVAGSGTVGRDGTWQVRLPSLPAGGPYIMKVLGGKPREIPDIHIGEVWLASGQSNMEWPVNETEEARELIAASTSKVRLFSVRRVSSEAPAPTAGGKWVRATLPEARRLTAIGFGFAHHLYRRLNVPVGIIQATWGGSRVESWISPRMLDGDPATQRIVDDYVGSQYDFEDRYRAYEADMAEYMRRYRRADPGVAPEAGLWGTPLFDDAAWDEVELPASFEGLLGGREFAGSAWFRRSVDLPTSWVGQPLRLDLDGVSGTETVHLNGPKLRSTRKGRRRSLFIDRGLTKTGPNVFAIRLYAGTNEGGVLGPALSLVNLRTKEVLDLSGAWKWKVERELAAPPAAERPVRPLGPGHRNSVSGAFHGMIAPILAFPMRGTIFYQGEANVGEAKLYGILMRELIRDWRIRAGEERRPFLFVQLPGYGVPPKEPGPSRWAELREAQMRALDLPGTEMAIGLDLGDPNTIHPRKKLGLAFRLAELALSSVYRRQGSTRSPFLESWQPEGRGLRVLFPSQRWLATSDPGPIRGLVAAGRDRKFVPAKGRLFRNTLFIEADGLERVDAVRYAWADAPDANLVDETGLPVAPFRTDDWPE